MIITCYKCGRILGDTEGLKPFVDENGCYICNSCRYGNHLEINRLDFINALMLSYLKSKSRVEELEEWLQEDIDDERLIDDFTDEMIFNDKCKTIASDLIVKLENQDYKELIIKLYD